MQNHPKQYEGPAKKQQAKGHQHKASQMTGTDRKQTDKKFLSDMKSECKKWEARFFRGTMKEAQNTWNYETGKLRTDTFQQETQK